MRLVLIAVAGLMVACTSAEDDAATTNADVPDHEKMETAADEVQDEIHGALEKAEDVEAVLDEAAQDRDAAIDDAD